MPPTLAILNNINGSSIFLLALLGLLLFGRDLPMIARNAARQYFRYRKILSDATSDIRREFENAANQIEEEKRKIEREVASEVPSLDDLTNPESKSEPAVGVLDSANSNGSANGNGNGNGAVHHAADVAPPKPQADPLALDIPAPSSLSHRASEPARSKVAQVAALDSFTAVPPPSKIPPPLD